MNLVHNFDEVVNRKNTDSKKYSEEFFPSDVIPMWIADTDFKAPQPIVDALVERMTEGIYGYTPISKRLHAAARYWEKTRFGWKIPEDAVEFVPGVISGIISSVRALSRPGDNIVINTPCYSPFTELAAHNGRHLLRNEMILKDGKYEIDFEDFEAKVSDSRTKLFILCNPQNPTGRVFTKEELTKMGELCMKYHVKVIADEIHSDIVYPGHTHIPFASLSKDFEENTVTFINPSKTFNVPGFRTAAFICMDPVIKSAIHDVVVNNKAFGENICGTIAFYTAYECCAYYADQLVEYLNENKKLMEKAFDNNEKMDLIKAEGTYLFWIDCHKLGMAQSELMDFFVKKIKIGVNNGIAFGPEGKGFVRMNIGCAKPVLIEALSRIEKAVKAL